MKLAAQLYTVREFTQTSEAMYDSLKKIKEIGYEYVQLSGGGYGKIDPAEIKSYLDELGLKAFVTHNGISRITQNTDEIIKEHKLLGCDYVGIGSMPKENRSSKEGYDAFLNDIIPAAKKLLDNGLKFVYHNHRFEFQKIDGDITGMDYMINNTDPKEFGLLVDTYWVQAGGACPARFIEKNANRIEVVHFKDLTIIDDNHTMSEVGKGNLDWEEIIPSCLKAGVLYAAVEQDTCLTNPFDCLNTSYEFLKNKF